MIAVAGWSRQPQKGTPGKAVAAIRGSKVAGQRGRLTPVEVDFTPEQEAQLSQIADLAGTDAERLVKNAALRLVEDDAQFRAAVQAGIAAADRGEFVTQEEVWANVEKILQS